MALVLFDQHRDSLLPLTWTRPTAAIRCGILTPIERWTRLSHHQVSAFTEDYLSVKYPTVFDNDTLCVSGNLIPGKELTKQILDLPADTALYSGDRLIAYRSNAAQCEDFLHNRYTPSHRTETDADLVYIQYPWDVFHYNGKAIAWDFDLLTQGQSSQPISSTNTVIGDPEKIFLAPGAKVEASILNTQNGPIYLAADAEIMEGCMVRGALALGEHAGLKMGAKIYGATTLGPHCKGGGEINNSVMFGYSNKGHDGFIGNTVIGEWCNLGADTNTSNLKNNYAEVRLWNYATQGFARTGLQFCGLVMGDHAKAGINTMFNTGTVVGVSANVFGDGFPRNFIPDFAWGGAAGFTSFKLSTAFEVATRMMERRNLVFDKTEQDIMSHVFEATASYRKF